MSLNATLLIQMTVFAVVVLFSMKFIWPMIMEAIEERNKSISDGLAAAEQGQKKLSEAETEVNALIKEAKQQACCFASLISAFTSVSASLSFFCPCSAAAKPSDILLFLSSMASIIIGQINFMLNRTTTAKTVICISSVAFKLILLSA